MVFCRGVPKMEKIENVPEIELDLEGDMASDGDKSNSSILREFMLPDDMNNESPDFWDMDDWKLNMLDWQECELT